MIHVIIGVGAAGITVTDERKEEVNFSDPPQKQSVKMTRMLLSQ